MPSELPETPPAGHRLDASRLVASTEQTTFSFDGKARVTGDQIQLRALFAAMVRVAGGVDWLTRSLDREPSYAARISDAINGRDERPVQMNWIAPLLGDPRAAELLVSWFCERCGFAPPVKERRVTREQLGDAALKVLAKMAGPLTESFREAIAKEVGAEIEDVRL